MVNKPETKANGRGVRKHLFLSYVLSFPRVVKLQGIASHQLKEVFEPATSTAVQLEIHVSCLKARELVTCCAMSQNESKTLVLGSVTILSLHIACS